MTVALVTLDKASIADRTFRLDWQLDVTESQVATLTRAIACGDTEAFARFYTLWFDRVYIMARACTGRDESCCLDVVQDSMMRVIRSIREMNDDAQLERWLHIVVRTCALDLLRRERRRRIRERNRQSVAPHHHTDADSDDRIAWLRSQLSQLPADQARLLSMRFRFGWTLARIGRTLGLKPGAVDGRLKRAMAALQAKAAQEFHHER